MLDSACAEKPPRRSAREVAEAMPRHAAKAYEFPPLKSASDFKVTDIQTNLESAISKGRNSVYCATVERASMFVDGCFAASGTSEEIINSLSERFHVGSEVMREIEADSPISLIYLRKSLPFFESFERLKEPVNFRSKNSTDKVAGFGWKEFADDSFSTHLQRDQVTILDDAGDDDFIIRLNTESKIDELILAKIPPLETLRATIEHVQERMRNSRLDGDERAKLEDGETLMVPIINVNVKKFFETEPLTVQLIQFRLDEKGAELESALYSMGIHDPVRKRRFVFDRPFLLYLKERHSDAPYFVAWIENSELLEVVN
jgi:hypothetical protein